MLSNGNLIPRAGNEAHPEDDGGCAHDGAADFGHAAAHYPLASVAGMPDGANSARGICGQFVGRSGRDGQFVRSQRRRGDKRSSATAGGH